MYKNDDISMYNFDCSTNTIVDKTRQYVILKQIVFSKKKIFLNLNHFKSIKIFINFTYN